MEGNGLWLTCGLGPVGKSRHPSKGHACASPPSHHGGPQGWWILTGVRVDVPEPSSEERSDEEGAEGDAQDSTQPQPTVCGRMRPSALPHWEGPTPIPMLTTSLALNLQLSDRQASFTVISSIFSKMVSFCRDGGWGERGKMCTPAR